MNEDKLHIMRHSFAHITAAAVQRLWPDAKFGVGPTVDNGFYYDIDLGETKISEANFAKIEKAMRGMIEYGDNFEKIEMPIDEAIQWAKDNNQPYKEELLNDLKRSGTTVAKDLDMDEIGVATDGESAVESVTFFKNGKFMDLCRGPHIANTKEAGAFKLLRIAGAYWRGKEGNPQMQRLYGVAFETQKELDEYLERLEQAKLRDHRKLGQELDLFTFSDLVGAGLPMYTPRGTVIIDQLKGVLKEISKKYNMLAVSIPHLAKIELYETSGHAAKFSDELFYVKSHYNQEFVLKPVNCPHHTQIYASSPRSYRDLPLRYVEQTMQYRDEKPGAIGGLQRTRGFTVDDGHTFCRPDQIEQEASMIVEVIRQFYTSIGLWGNHWVSLSVSDKKTPEKYIGEPDDWVLAEKMLTDVASKYNLEARIMEGEAAIYGPKIDFMFQDAIGRETQLATIQLDFAMPKRFGLKYIDQNGQDRHPVMIHRAILGSFERFIMLLIEHFAGWFPFWLAPEQVRILTINDTIGDYVKEVEVVLRGTILMKPIRYGDVRFTLDDRNESLGKKIREATNMKIPVQLIVGQKDKDAREVSVRTQTGEEKIKLDDLSDYLQKI
ncbi:threonine--tRNA ligase [Candidatus Saccharibacteria bacterium CG11_big_fil_rev_8_21_14_0_20_41_19]|nr:threonine--tRNA ligase [Candidatus Saccharibacteria bacterium]OIP85690.1 MAG: threonine--tRNA ligase [Candidatus Saccharibacteria bacterium CG2_30_41_52]PIQ70561.1 MAG: threonine--tRNA ligase [Candidatus Saccharibacteria bacterium CG11_big_fil_rev_8_21_14_0_20_41_19]PIZ60859.1 MAG: threonine--tRNA ligase [Candidatus Saccharibacteria bacterium CG_4_10_14_0_2_um_filter_41_11]PJC29456.1 MAG: threonine--tRNA ligase [Candidatus Saccharibacteria bacterium CG_4_9_14_0_2_um_filter_41_9]